MRPAQPRSALSFLCAASPSHFTVTTPFRQRSAVEAEEYTRAGLRLEGKLPPELLAMFAPYAS